MLEHRVIEMIAEERIQQYQAEVAHEQLLRANLTPSIPLHRRLAVSFATWLIAAGTAIQQRYEPLSYVEPEPDCSPC